VYSIIIIDDHPLIRRGIKDLVCMDESFEVIGEADNGTHGLELATSLQADIVLLDLNMEKMNGLQTLQAMKTADIDSRIIILTVSDNEKDIVATLRAGADGYLLKDMEPEDMLERLHQVVDGHIVLSQKVSELVVRGLHEESQNESREEAELTKREEEILSLIAKGLSNKEIGRKLDIVEGTVKVHVKNLLRKLNLRSRVEAAVWAVEKHNKKPAHTG
jgi:two-component system, NarL family, nitrate/nitrite response regulator NarL